jgi:hypothetical protein
MTETVAQENPREDKTSTVFRKPKAGRPFTFPEIEAGLQKRQGVRCLRKLREPDQQMPVEVLTVKWLHSRFKLIGEVVRYRQMSHGRRVLGAVSSEQELSA